MISTMFSLQDILLSFENILRIEYVEKDADKIIGNAKKKLENAYQVKLDKPVYEVQVQNAFVSESLDVFLDQIVECMKSIAAYTCVVMFTRINPIALADVNYLGNDPKLLRAQLKCLQDKKLYEQRSTIVPALRNAVSNVDMSPVKRLLVIMLMLEELGLPEAVAVIAQYLYLGTLDI
jgi:hypothetical protein